MKKPSNGFTIIELLVVIAIIGILTTIGIVSFSNIQSGSRNTQRSSKVTVIAEALEKYYSQNGEYPTCGVLTQPVNTVVTTTLKGVDTNALASPTSASGTNSIVCEADTSNLTSDVFGYVGGGSSYTLEYRDESTGNNVSLASRHGAGTIAAPTSLTATTTSNTSINLSWGLTLNANSYTLQRDTSSSFATATTIATQAGTMFSDSSLSQGTPYYYRVQGTGTNGTSGWSNTASATTTINTPSAPVVTANTVTTTTTWSWPAVTCAAGTTARYQYRYTVSPAGSDSGIVAIATTSVPFTTSTEGQTYTVNVQAQCYNAAATSGWSVAGSASWYHPITQYTLTTAAGTGGTVSSGGTYNTGTVQAITAIPSTYYSFTSWSGSTGCSGVASHTITMDANKSCTANFTPTAIGTPTMTAVTTPTTGDTTTWSWSAVSCADNTARYRYDYLIDSVSQAPAGWKTPTVPTATSINFTTVTEGHTYAVLVQAQCYNAVTSSAWSASSNTASWYHPITTYTLTTIAGTNGTVSSGGTYNTGTVQTITATPTSASYSTFSSWSGSTGCSGVASHTITMDANKSCTASFTLNPWIPGLAGDGMAGKYAYYMDAPGTYIWQDRDVGCPSGGRSPTTAELRALAYNTVYYGNNFIVSGSSFYWSNADAYSGEAYAVKFDDGSLNGYVSSTHYDGHYYIRCVKP